MYHICFAHSFHTFLRNLLKHTSKDSQIHGDLLTPLQTLSPVRGAHDVTCSKWVSQKNVPHLNPEYLKNCARDTYGFGVIR